jgi:hypothetical protein
MSVFALFMHQKVENYLVFTPANQTCFHTWQRYRKKLFPFSEKLLCLAGIQKMKKVHFYFPIFCPSYLHSSIKLFHFLIKQSENSNKNLRKNKLNFIL